MRRQKKSFVRGKNAKNLKFGITKNLLVGWKVYSRNIQIVCSSQTCHRRIAIFYSSQKKMRAVISLRRSLGVRVPVSVNFAAARQSSHRHQAHQAVDSTGGHQHAKCPLGINANASSHYSFSAPSPSAFVPPSSHFSSSASAVSKLGSEEKVKLLAERRRKERKAADAAVLLLVLQTNAAMAAAMVTLTSQTTIQSVSTPSRSSDCNNHNANHSTPQKLSSHGYSQESESASSTYYDSALDFTSSS